MKSIRVLAYRKKIFQQVCSAFLFWQWLKETCNKEAYLSPKKNLFDEFRLAGEGRSRISVKTEIFTSEDISARMLSMFFK